MAGLRNLGLGVEAASWFTLAWSTLIFQICNPGGRGKGVWKVRQSMGGASALANCSGSDLWETNEGRTWNLSGPGPHPIGQDTVPYLIRVLAWESAI